MKRTIILLTSLYIALILLLLGNAHTVGRVEASPIDFAEGFEDDFIAGRSVPDLVDAGLSSSFSPINEKRPDASGKITIRDRGIGAPGGVGGGFPPNNDNAFVDFSDGQGTFMTFRFSTGGLEVGSGSTVTFDVVAFGGDGGSLFKYVSSDGITFTQVGDASDANGSYSFDLATGGTEAFFRLQVGTSAGVFDGLYVDDIRAAINVPAVGGIPVSGELAGLPLETGSPGTNVGVLAGVIAGVTAGALALGGAAWYSRRRRLR